VRLSPPSPDSPSHIPSTAELQEPGTVVPSYFYLHPPYSYFPTLYNSEERLQMVARLLLPSTDTSAGTSNQRRLHDAVGGA
jgi:hypothetical protein